MDGKIPDFGRGTIDKIDSIVSDFLRKKKPQKEEKGLPGGISLFTRDMADLSGIMEEAPSKKKWTVLLYMDGNNNLYGPMYDAMKGLEKTGSNKDVNLVVELGGNPGDKPSGGAQGALMDMLMKNKKIETVGRYYVTKDLSDSDKITSPKLKDLGVQDMGDPQVVKDFIDWGIQTFPAEHYAIVLFNHGAGFAGCLSDEKTGNLIDANELKDIIEHAAKTADKKIDLVDFDACLMSQLEVAHAIKDNASYMVASEETERGSAQPLPRILEDLKEGSQNQAMSPEDLAKLFVYESFHQNGGNILTTTLSALDLEKIGKVVESADSLAKVLMAGTVDPSIVRRDINKSDYYCHGLSYKLFNDFHDLGHFAEIVKDDKKINDENVKKRAAELAQSIDDAVVAVEHQGKKYRHSTGISAYMPTNYGYDPRPKTDSVNFSSTHNYESIPFSKETQWDEMIKSISKDSTWHNMLKTFGISQEGIEALDRKLHVTGTVAMGLTKAVLSTGKLAGHYEAYKAMRTGAPGGFFGLGSEVAVKLGMLGGGYKVFQGVKGIYDAVQKDAPEGITDILFSKKMKIVNGSLNVAEGGALLAVNTALLLGISSGLTSTAAILSFALPVAKIIYDAINIPKNLKARAEEMSQENPTDSKTVQQKLQELDQAGGELVK